MPLSQEKKCNPDIRVVEMDTVVGYEGSRKVLYIRRICPKGTSFDHFTQENIDLMMSHINSSIRESLGGHTPLEMARMMLPKELLDYFNLQEISPDDVNLTPKLLKK